VINQYDLRDRHCVCLGKTSLVKEETRWAILAPPLLALLIHVSKHGRKRASIRRPKVPGTKPEA
jgi:hypothetical protein